MCNRSLIILFNTKGKAKVLETFGSHAHLKRLTVQANMNTE